MVDGIKMAIPIIYTIFWFFKFLTLKNIVNMFERFS